MSDKEYNPLQDSSDDENINSLPQNRYSGINVSSQVPLNAGLPIRQATNPIQFRFTPQAGMGQAPQNNLIVTSITTASNSKKEDTPRSIGPWTEHVTEDGKVFYFNKETNKSVWEKPDVFKDEKEKLIDSCDWKAYTSDDGKEYYHNEKLNKTQWEKPPEYVAHMARIEQVLSEKKTVGKKPIVIEGDGSNLTSEEKIELFKEALKAHGVHVTMSQDDAFNLIHNTKEWNLLKFSEKKTAFHSYIQELKSQEEKVRKRKAQELENDFIQVLFDHKPEITREVRFRDAMVMIATKPQYLAVPSADREKLFYTFCKLKEEKILEEEKKKKKEDEDALTKILEESSMSLETSWSDFKEKLKDDRLFSSMNIGHSLQVFQNFVKNMERKEKDELRAKEAERKLRSRKLRDQFRILLDEQLSLGEITKKTYWSKFRPGIVNDQRYLNMLDPDLEGSTPAELFYSVVTDLEDKYEKEKKLVKETLKELNLNIIEPPLEFEAFVAKIIDHPNYELLDEANIELIFKDIKDKHTRTIEKTKSNAKKRFQDIMKDSSIPHDMTWEILLPIIEEKSDITSLPLTETEKFDIFEKEMKFRKEDDDFQEKLNITIKKEREKEKDKERRGRGADRRYKDKYRDNRDSSRDFNDKYSKHSRSKSRSPSPKQKRKRTFEEEGNTRYDSKDTLKKHKRDSM